MSEPSGVHCRRRQHLLHRTAAGFTLIELMVVVAVLGVIALLAGPSFLDMIVMQRLRGINAQLVTDLQFARSEAVAQGKIVRVNFGSATDRTCYVIYTAASSTNRCSCLSSPVCPAGSGWSEVRTVTVPNSTKTTLVWPTDQDSALGFDPVTGGLLSIPTDVKPVPMDKFQVDARVDDDRRLRTTVNQTGRPTVCAPNSSRMGVAACPPA